MKLDRYHRQMLLAGIDRDGQLRLASSHVLLVGCGALGGVIAEMLTRAGVGMLTLVDRDVVELTNLQRQVLFDEADAAAGAPKAIAARRRLKAINSEVTVRAYVDDFNASNAEQFIAGVDVILDGLDNYETRYLLNDLAVKQGVPLIHGGAVGTTGTAMTIVPGVTPCLRCIFPEIPASGSGATCDTVGVLGPLVAMIACHEASEAIKLLTGNVDAVDRTLLSIDVWGNRTHRTDLSSSRDPDCPCCARRAFDFLDGSMAASAVTLCGRNAVQINPASNGGGSVVDLAALAERLAHHGEFSHNQHLLRGTFAGERGDGGDVIELTFFPTGRAIFKGTDRAEHARALYARYIGT